MKLSAFILILICFGIVPVRAQVCQQLVANQWALGNPTAALSAQQYGQMNRRDLSEYEDIIGGVDDAQNSFVALVPKKGLAIDVGGGVGLAYQELAKIKDVVAVVINTQDFPMVDSKKTKGKFLYRRGWAQEVLPSYAGQADLVTDIWGAFSYEKDKALILDLIYGALKPGGRAFVLYHSIKTPALVRVGKGKTIHLDQWLIQTYPDIFSSYSSPGRNTQWAGIIEIKKSASENPITSVGLRLVKSKLISMPSRDPKKPGNILPESEFVPVRK